MTDDKDELERESDCINAIRQSYVDTGTEIGPYITDRELDVLAQTAEFDGTLFTSSQNSSKLSEAALLNLADFIIETQNGIGIE